MGDDATFLTAIRANPGDDAARLVYAAWLDEHGRPGGAFLRAECALSALEPTDPRRVELQARLRDAGTGVDPRWVATVGRAPIENCPAEFQSRCPKRWERLSPLRSEAARGCDQCGQEVVFCCSLGMAQARRALRHRVAIDPRLVCTPRDLESNPDDVARLIHTAAYDTSLENDPIDGGRYEYVSADEAIRTLRRIFSRRGFTAADAALIRMYAPDAPAMGADILRGLLPWTLPIIEAMLDDPLPRARQAAVSALRLLYPADREALFEAAGKPEGRILGLWSRLLRALDDEHPDVRTAAVLAVPHLQDWKSNLLTGGYEALVRRLAVETDAGVRLEMFKVLHRDWIALRKPTPNLEPARAALLADLNNGDWVNRSYAADLLYSAHLSGPDVVTAMVGRLDDPNLNVRLKAAEYLEREGVVTAMPKAATALIDGLADGGTGARVRAAEFLERFGDASALPKLRAALNDPSNRLDWGYSKPIRHYIQAAITAIQSRCEASDQSKAPGKKKRKRGK